MERALATVRDQPRVLQRHSSAVSRVSSIGEDVEIVKHEGIVFVDTTEGGKQV